MEHSGANMQPLGGDGTNGTVEWPEYSESYSNNLKSAWCLFTHEEQCQLIKALNEDN